LFKKYKYDPAFLIKGIFSDFYWNTSNGKILITFDDGPNPGTTEKILDSLKREKIKAVFFCVGNNVRKFPALTEEILKEGHTIGNHTFNHKRLTAVHNNEIHNEINSFNSLLKEQFNYDTNYFRPPYGRFNLRLRKLLMEKKLLNVMWSLLTYDYKNDINLIKLGISQYLKKNSIVVMHDSFKSEKVVIEGIKIVIEESLKNGFEIGEPAGCLS
jgi:peptidoglycan/xylan/chitin deacetylase (PgdA/CDA1 family)